MSQPRTLNTVHLIGNLGRDPIVYTEDGKVDGVDLLIATNEMERDGDGELREITTWHDVGVVVDGHRSRKLAESLTTRRRGDRVLVEGRIARDHIRAPSWVRATKVIFL